MAGNVDLFGGGAGGKISGVNNFHVDKNPLDQLEASISGILKAEWAKRQPGDLGAFLTGLIEAIWDATGLDLSGPTSLFNSISHLLDQIQIDIQQFVDHILQVLTDLTGIDFVGINNGIHTFFDQLVHNIFNWTGGLNFASPEALVESIWHLLQGAFDDMWKIIAQVFSTPFDVIEQGIEGVTEWVLDTVFGLVAPDRIPVLPISHLIESNVNLLTNPTFTDIGIDASKPGQWVVDTAVTHDVGPGSGSARIDCDGNDHDLFSTDLIPMGAGQRMQVYGWVKTENLVGPVGCININIAQYGKRDGSDEPTYINLKSVPQTGTTDWTKHVGTTYVCPPFGVEAVRVNLSVESTAKAGKVWFDDLYAGMVGQLQITWVDGLNDELQALLSGVVGFVNTLTGGAVAGIAEGIADLEEWVANLGDKLAQLLGLDKWQEFVNGIIYALTGQDQLGTTDLTKKELEALAQTATSNKTLLTQLQAQLAAMGTPNGISGGDDFEIPPLQPDGSPSPTVTDAAAWASRGWFEQRIGLPALDGGYFIIRDRSNAEWKGRLVPITGDGAMYFRTDPDDAKTLTPYQQITRVTGSRIAQAFLLGEAGDLLMGRVSDDRKNFVEMRADRGNVTLTLVVGNTRTRLETADAPDPSVGCSYTLECGTKEGLRVYRILRNNSVMLVHADIANKTAVLDANRGWGWGGTCAGALSPSSVHSVAVADNVPKGVVV